MKIALLGAAGYIGRTAAALLARRDDVGELILVDYDIRGARRLAKTLSPKCRWAMADVGKPAELSRLLEGIDAAAIAVGPCSEYETTALRSCAASGVPAVSIGEEAIAPEDRRGIDAAFRDAGTYAVTGCGLMPGWTELLETHFLPAEDANTRSPVPVPVVRYLFFCPARFGGYVFLRRVLKGITCIVPAPAGGPEGRYFALSDGSRIGVPTGAAGNRFRGIVGTAGKLGAAGKEFAAAMLLWLRGTMDGPAGSPAAAAGVAAGDRFARVEDPLGNLAAELFAESAVRTAALRRKSIGLLAVTDLFGRRETEELAERAGATIVTG